MSILDDIGSGLAKAGQSFSSALSSALGGTASGRLVNAALDVVDPNATPRVVDAQAASYQTLFLVVGAVVIVYYWRR